MKNNFCSMYPFLEAVRGNWRNAVFIECVSCPYSRTDECSGYLMAADAEGKLVLMPVTHFQRKTGQQVEKTECIGIMERRVFVTVFSLFLEWHTVSDEACSLLQILQMFYGNPCDKKTIS